MGGGGGGGVIGGTGFAGGTGVADPLGVAFGLVSGTLLDVDRLGGVTLAAGTTGGADLVSTWVGTTGVPSEVDVCGRAAAGVDAAVESPARRGVAPGPEVSATESETGVLSVMRQL